MQQIIRSKTANGSSFVQRMLPGLCALLTLLIGSASARAENGDVNSLIEAHDSKDRLKHEYAQMHADLVARGIFAANTTIVYVRKEPPLYCQPLALQLTGEQVIDILRRSTAQEPSIGVLSTGIGILTALQRTFPCEK